MKKKIFYEIAILIALAIVLGVTYTLITKQGFFSDRTLSLSAKVPELELIPLARAKELFESKSALFIDTRHEFDYKNGHIRDAVNVALNEFDTHRVRLDKTPKDKLLVVYCDGADCNSSIEMAIKLMELGFTNVTVFFGGWQEWKSADLPVEK